MGAKYVNDDLYAFDFTHNSGIFEKKVVIKVKNKNKLHFWAIRLKDLFMRCLPGTANRL